MKQENYYTISILLFISIPIFYFIFDSFYKGLGFKIVICIILICIIFQIISIYLIKKEYKNIKLNN